MTDSTSGPDPLTPEEEAAVSRMLAEAAGPVAMPDQVAARLQGVLDDLAADRAGSPGRPSDAAGAGGEIVSLQARRRWPKVLLAAAAVVAGGYGVTAALGNGSIAGSDSASSADSAVAGAAEAGPDSTQLQDRDSARDSEDSGASGGATGSDRRGGSESAPSAAVQLAMSGRPVRLRSENLPDGAQRALRVLELSGADTLMDQQFGEGARCGGPATDGRERLTVRYDGDLAVLVAGASQGGLVEVTIYSCQGSVLDSTVVVR